jgi:hypothetical protein
MRYRCDVPTIEGFVQQLAVSYVAHGYWFYVTGLVPDGTDPAYIDDLLISKYQIDVSKFVRARRKAAGLANIQYLRHRSFYVLLATAGEHRYYLSREAGGEGTWIRDIQRVPLKFASYAISYAHGHVSVRIERETYQDLKAYFAGRALWAREKLAAELHSLLFEPYVPIRKQFFGLLGEVNRRRTAAGFEPVPASCLRLRRRPIKPFEFESLARTVAA